MLQTKNMEPSGFRLLTDQEIAAVSGGNGPGPEMTEADIQFQMLLQTLSPMQQAEFLDSIGLPSGIGPMGNFGDGDGYDSDIDHCTLAPDTVMGVDLSYICYNHDQDYGADSTLSRMAADLKFFASIYTKFISEGFIPQVAMLVATTYYEGVALAGHQYYKGQGENYRLF